MKNILALTTAQDLTDWGTEFLVVQSPDIAVDPATGLNRAAVVKSFEILPEATTVIVNIVLYLLDNNGNPLNGFQKPEDRNVVPVQIEIPATNDSYISLSTFEVITDLTGLTYGVDYLEEYEAYRLQAKGGPIDLFALMALAINQSTKI